MRILLLISLISLFLPKTTYACICHGIPSFCSSLQSVAGQDGFLPDDVLLVHGKVVDKIYQGIQLSFVDLLHGNEAAGDTIFINNGDGSSCGVSTGPFEVGREYLVLVQASPAYLRHYDLISICLSTFLAFNEEGNLFIQNEDSIQYLSTEDLMISGDCTLWRIFHKPVVKYPFPREPVFENSLVLSPNPVDRRLSVSYRLTEPMVLTMEIFNISGQKAVRYHPGFVDHIGILEFDLSRLPQGIYLVKLVTGEEQVIKKILKQ